jgi:hypothetical protein
MIKVKSEVKYKGKKYTVKETNPEDKKSWILETFSKAKKTYLVVKKSTLELAVFEAAAKPMVDYLRKYNSPHHKVEVTTVMARLFDGKLGVPFK